MFTPCFHLDDGIGLGTSVPLQFWGDPYMVWDFDGVVITWILFLIQWLGLLLFIEWHAFLGGAHAIWRLFMFFKVSCHFWRVHLLKCLVFYFWETVATILHHSLTHISLAYYFIVTCWIALLGMQPSLCDTFMKGLKYYLMANSWALQYYFSICLTHQTWSLGYSHCFYCEVVESTTP